MAGLIYKDLIIAKKSVLLGFGIMVFSLSLILIMPMFVDNGMLEAEEVTGILSVFVFFMIFLITGIMAGDGFFSPDESKKWAYFIASSPALAKGQIRSKYLLVLLIYVALVFWCDLLSTVMAAFGCPANSFIAIIMMFVMLILNAIEFPFLVRFGCKVGGNVKTAMIMFLMLIVFEYMFFGDLSVFGSAEKFFELMEKLSRTQMMSDIALVLLAAFPYVSIGLYYLSYKISCKLYMKGVEEYER